ncbi:MAG: ribosomal protein S18-alanine N-acetyltransferase [Lachnospiraceae bacterium]|nr:ribosomal protein S18-alanine N-acetyltransferase [Lachnospiraceae bacterium]
MITFHRMQPEDLIQVSRLEAQTFTMPWSLDAYRRALGDENTLYIVAKDGAHVVGSCGVRNILSEGEITNVMVEEAYRGKSIGTSLLMRLLDEGEKIGIESFFLEVRCSNEPAIALYQKCGFRVEGVRKNLYEKPAEDGLVMWRRPA